MLVERIERERHWKGLSLIAVTEHGEL